MDQLRTRLDSHLREAATTVVGLLGAATEDAALVSASEHELFGVIDTIEALGRAVDAFRVLAAGEVAHRSRPVLGREGLAYRLGCGSPAELLERTARILPATARARMKLGEQTRPSMAVTGASLPAEYASVAEGLSSGYLGVDSAAAITAALAKVKPAVPPERQHLIAQGEYELVCSATGTSPAPDVAAAPPVTPTETIIQAAVWAATLNPDGAEPSEKVFEARAFSLHRPKDGLIPVSGLLLPEVAGQVQRVFDTLTNPRQSVKFLSDAQRAALEAEDGPKDPRSRAQRQHDALATVFDVAGRSDQLPTLGGASATMVVSILNTDLAAGKGVGHVDGLHLPISLSAVQQLTCANGIQPLTLDRDWQILAIGTTERTFNRAQRRALAVRDGGCILCGMAAWACEAHHVIPWPRVHRTDVANGVLLCWYHHRTIETSGWKIRMVRGHPEIMPPPHLGPQTWTPARGSALRRQAALNERLDREREARDREWERERDSDRKHGIG